MPRDSAEATQQALVARLSDEVRRGHVPRSPGPRSRGILLALIALALAGAGVFVTYQAMHRQGARASAPQETLPAGTEQVLPADLGTGAAGTPALDGAGAASTPNPGTTATPSPGAPETQAAGPADEMPAAPPAKLDAKTLANLRYEVHVASFTADGQARLLVKRLRDKGLDAWYAKATNQRNWYRVFVGHYATHEEASRQAASLLGSGVVEHAIAYPDHAR